MKSPAYQLRDVVLTDVNLDVRGPHLSKRDYSFAIELQTSWSLTGDRTLYVSFPDYSFVATDDKTKEKAVTADIRYFCAAGLGQERLPEMSEEIASQLTVCAEPVLLHYFVRDLNDLLVRSGYPAIRFSGISAALKETAKTSSAPEGRPTSA
jgi:hypothetical protein